MTILTKREELQEYAEKVASSTSPQPLVFILQQIAATAGSKTYILRSVLDPRLIHAAAQTDEQINEEEAKEAPSDDEDDEILQGGYTPRYYGSIISWSRSEQPGPIGILYVVLAIILVNGRVIPDSMSIRYNLAWYSDNLFISGLANEPEAPPITCWRRSTIQHPFNLQNAPT